MNTVVMAGRASRRRCRSAERAPLPGEVVSRRRRTERKEPPEEPPLLLDPRAVFALKPERRLKWLTSALQRLQQGKVQSSGIYDILVHNKFPQDAPNRIGSKMYLAVCEHIALFSQKQQRFLETESKLAQLFKDRAAAAGGEGGPAASGDQPENAESLVEKLLTLPPSEGEKFMATLDEASRDRLEELLEARILARARGGGAAQEAAAATPAGGATPESGPPNGARGAVAVAPTPAHSPSHSGSSDSGSSRRGGTREKGGRRSRSRGRGRSPSQGRRRYRSRQRGDSRSCSGRR
mmetsp:Transcript_64849/g.193246  ORF Transcript_64849/g.193246 Transcript_64849/m.193246 type:complete len:294 (+) Transcript_64849:207-1088(+)